MADDGWTHVAKSKRTRAPKPVNGHNPPSKEITVESLNAEITSKLKTWKQSSCRKSLLVLLDRVQPDTGWNIQGAICLGSGSLSRDNVECRRRSVWQMVAFLDIAKTLGAGEWFAQEPTFTDLDQEFLKTFGVKVLGMSKEQDSGALGPVKDRLGQKAFLFEPFVDMNAAMVQELLDKDIGLYIGSSIKGLVEKGERAGATAESRKRLAKDIVAGDLAKQFCHGKARYSFPIFDLDPNIFDGMGIYWKEEADSDEGG